MTYSTPGGYGPPHGPSTPGYGPQSPGYGAPPAGEDSQGKGSTAGLPFYFNIGVVVLGVLNFFLGFLPYISGASAEFAGESISVSSSANFFMTNGLVSTSLLLVAGLVAAVGMLPKQDIHEGAVASLSVVGFVSLLFQLVSLPGEAKLGIGLIIVLITSFVQAALAITALLFSSDIIKPPAPKQAQYGYYGQGGYGQPQPPSSPPSQPQQPYYGAGPGPGSYPPPPPSQPQW
jgi:Family of unknown function (DUF5336)